LEERLVFRDIFLDGNTFVSSHRVDKEPLVGDVQLGFVYMFGDIRFAFSKLFRTHEFKTQTASESYGAINLSFRY
jgi:lipid A 3-O-deacylase